jgi:hypothetical protein
MAAAIQNRHNMSIDTGTFTKGVGPFNVAGAGGVNGDVTLDQVHDEIFPSLKGKPSTWEDQILRSTMVSVTQQPILEIISSFGKCVRLHNRQILGELTQPNEGLIPYTIPDNRFTCYIRDCFSGIGIPGLNNIFDQATMSLKSFIEYHNKLVTTPVFRNPLDVNGGLGQQLYAAAAADARLKYTAYFNYDLLMFVYITLGHPIPQINEALNVLRTKVANAINGLSDMLTPAEIETINIININYLWCKLMIYCDESIRADSYLTGSHGDYLPAMNKLTQIRFESFAKNGDNYFTNPIFGYRGNDPVDTTQNVTPETLTYIDSLCLALYTASVVPGFGSQMNNRGLRGGVQYVTTQSMVAQAMTNAIGKHAGIIARNANNKDPIQNACANEIDKLFKHAHLGIAAVPALSLLQIGRGWSMVKFSGDSSHIVFGETLEAIKAAAANGATNIAAFASKLTDPTKIAEWNADGNSAAWAAANGASPEGVFYLILVPNRTDRFNFKIVYLIEERPLTARLLAAGKNIFVEGTKLIMDRFTGFGSEDKYDRHAALYIEFDLTSSYINIAIGYHDKIKKYVANPNNYTNTQKYMDPVVAQGLAALPINDLAEAREFLFNSIGEGSPEDADITPEYLRGLAGRIAARDFTVAFELDNIIIKLNSLFALDKLPNYNLLADTLVGKGFPRMSRATNWKALMIVLQSTNIDAAGGTPSSGTQNGYYDMKEILSIISKLYNDGYNVLANQAMVQLLTNTEGLLKVLNKMVSSFESVRTIADIFSRDKIVKYDAFTQDRISEWMRDKSGESPPSKIELMVNGLKEFVDLCLDVRAKYKENGGGDTRLLGGGMDNNDGFMVGGELSEEINSEVIERAALRSEAAELSAEAEELTAEAADEPLDEDKLLELQARLNQLQERLNQLQERLNNIEHNITHAIVTEFAKYSPMDIESIQIYGLIEDNILVSNDNGLITKYKYIKEYPIEEDMEGDTDDTYINEIEKLDKIIVKQVTPYTDEDIIRSGYNIVFDAMNILDSIRERPLDETNELHILQILNFSVEDIILLRRNHNIDELIRYEQIRRIVAANLIPVFVDILARESAVYETYDQHMINLRKMITSMFEIHKKLSVIDETEFNKRMLYELSIQIRKKYTPAVNLNALYEYINDKPFQVVNPILTSFYTTFPLLFSDVNVYLKKSAQATIPATKATKSVQPVKSTQVASIGKTPVPISNVEKQKRLQMLKNFKKPILNYIILFLNQEQQETFYDDHDFIAILVCANKLREIDNIALSRSRAPQSSMVLRDIPFFETLAQIIVNKESKAPKNKSRRKKPPNNGGKKTRRKRHIQTKTTKKLRYVTKTAQRKKTKNANRSKTRRKRHN